MSTDLSVAVILIETISHLVHIPTNSIFASFNDTFVHVTDMSGKETVTRVTGKSSTLDTMRILRQSGLCGYRWGRRQAHSTDGSKKSKEAYLPQVETQERMHHLLALMKRRCGRVQGFLRTKLGACNDTLGSTNEAAARSPSTTKILRTDMGHSAAIALSNTDY